MVDVTKTQKGEETKARILQAAAELFDERGYFGTGINEILRRANTPKGSIYFHFPGGKEEIAEYAMRAVGVQVNEMIDEVIKDETDPAQAIVNIIGLFRARLTETNFACGCPVSTISMELSGSGLAASDACADAYRMWNDTSKAYLLQHFQKKQAASLADSTFCFLQGALLFARATHDLTPLDVAEVNCRKLVNEALRASN